MSVTNQDALENLSYQFHCFSRVTMRPEQLLSDTAESSLAALTRYVFSHGARVLIALFLTSCHLKKILIDNLYSFGNDAAALHVKTNSSFVKLGSLIPEIFSACA